MASHDSDCGFRYSGAPKSLRSEKLAQFTNLVSISAHCRAEQPQDESETEFARQGNAVQFAAKQTSEELTVVVLVGAGVHRHERALQMQSVIPATYSIIFRRLISPTGKIKQALALELLFQSN